MFLIMKIVFTKIKKIVLCGQCLHAMSPSGRSNLTEICSISWSLSQKLLGNLKFWKTAALQDLSLSITLVKAILKLSYCFVKFYDVINQYCSQSRGYGVSTCRVTVIHKVYSSGINGLINHKCLC